MKSLFRNLIVLLGLHMLAASWAHAQCDMTVSSTDGYDVLIDLTATSIDAPALCPNGYNFNVVFDYDISFSGSNVPANLYTLQGNFICGSFTNNFFNLPNTGGMDSGISSGNPYNLNTDCATVTPQSLGCTTVQITIQGPGISLQTIDCDLALPVELFNFSVLSQGERVEISWQTAVEINNKEFYVERSSHHTPWEEIAHIYGAGQSNSIKSYSLHDLEPIKGNSFYRIKQIDFDGSIHYSSIREFNYSKLSDEILIYPNPVDDFLNISHGLSSIQSLRVLDMTGRDVSDLIIEAENNKGRLVLDISKIPAGSYLIVFDGNRTIVSVL